MTVSLFLLLFLQVAGAALHQRDFIRDDADPSTVRIRNDFADNIAGDFRVGSISLEGCDCTCDCSNNGKGCSCICQCEDQVIADKMKEQVINSLHVKNNEFGKTAEGQVLDEEHAFYTRLRSGNSPTKQLPTIPAPIAKFQQQAAMSRPATAPSPKEIKPPLNPSPVKKKRFPRKLQQQVLLQ